MVNTKHTSVAVLLKPENIEQVALFFEAVVDDPFFKPHAFTYKEAVRVCKDAGTDLYFGIFVGEKMVSYGMLRGWGFEYPSLGVIVLPECRGNGFGRSLMVAMHNEARLRGAMKIRLRVHPGNVLAKQMYERLGYHFDGVIERGELVGLLVLGAKNA